MGKGALTEPYHIDLKTEGGLEVKLASHRIWVSKGIPYHKSIIIGLENCDMVQV